MIKHEKIITNKQYTTTNLILVQVLPLDKNYPNYFTVFEPQKIVIVSKNTMNTEIYFKKADDEYEKNHYVVDDLGDYIK